MTCSREDSGVCEDCSGSAEEVPRPVFHLPRTLAELTTASDAWHQWRLHALQVGWYRRLDGKMNCPMSSCAAAGFKDKFGVLVHGRCQKHQGLKRPCLSKGAWFEMDWETVAGTTIFLILSLAFAGPFLCAWVTLLVTGTSWWPSNLITFGVVSNAVIQPLWWAWVGWQYRKIARQRETVWREHAADRDRAADEMFPEPPKTAFGIQWRFLDIESELSIKHVCFHAAAWSHVLAGRRQILLQLRDTTVHVNASALAEAAADEAGRVYLVLQDLERQLACGLAQIRWALLEELKAMPTADALAYEAAVKAFNDAISATNNIKEDIDRAVANYLSLGIPFVLPDDLEHLNRPTSGAASSDG